MNWLSWLPLAGGGVLVVAIAAFAILNPIRALALAKDIGAFFIDKFRALVKWAKDPDRNWWKIACTSLAGVCLLLAWYAHDRHREVIVVTERCKTEKLGLEQQYAPVRTAAFNNFQELQACLADLGDVVGEDQETERLNAEAVARAEARARQAAKEAADWRRRYEARPATCTAALTALEEACESVSDY